MSKLCIVATPIGNLRDITLRALEILKEADVILAEDTRVTRKLLSHFGISKQVLRYVYGKKYAGYENIAFVTDAGTPAISDPGTNLIRNFLDAGFEIVSVPGPSALTAAISASDINLSDFLFLGFPPTKKGRKKFFEKVAKSEFPVILFESPHRILKTLGELHSIAGNRYVNVARELTKIYEEIFRGSISEAIEYFKGEKKRGEFVIIINV